MSRTGTTRKPQARPTNAGKRIGRYCQMCGICGGYKPAGQTDHKCYEVKHA